MSPIVRSGVSEKGLRTTPFSSRNTLDGRSLDRGWRWPMGACQGVSVAGGGGLAWLAAGGLWPEVAAFSANATLRKTELSTATPVTILAAKQRTAWSAKVGFIFASSIGSVDAVLMHNQPKLIDLDCRHCSHFAETDRRSAEHCVVTLKKIAKAMTAGALLTSRASGHCVPLRVMRASRILWLVEGTPVWSAET